MLYRRRLSEALRAKRDRPLALDVLDEVCQTRQTDSAVTLTDALVRRGRLYRYGDPLGLIIATLAELNHQGLVVYRVRETLDSMELVPRHIRATREGFDLAGYRLRASEVGQERWRQWRDPKHDGAVRHPGDRTDFRTHWDKAVPYGEIESMPLEWHIGVYPDHPCHRAQLAELMEAKMSTNTRSRFDAAKVAVIEHAVIEHRTGGRTWDDLARETGIARGTLSSWESFHGRVAGNKTYQPWSNVRRDKVDAAGVVYRESIDAANDAIERATGRTPEPEEATGQPVEATIDDSSTPVGFSPSWPVLAELLGRRSEQAQADERANAWIEAAAILEATDPETAAMLESKAEALASEHAFTRIEDEFMRYHEWASDKIARLALATEG